MWRFILVTFAFLGFAFWEMSGGADYAPHQNSIQAQATQPDPQPDTTVATAQPAAPERIELSQPETPERFQITLASIGELAEAGSAQDTARTERVDDKARFLTEPKTSEDSAVLAALDDPESAEREIKQNWPGAIELFEHQASQAQLRRQAEAAARASMDIRYITASSANMRGGPGTDYGKIGRLTEGAEVAVLNAPGNGWLELQVTETGETGWMADWLVSEPAQ